MKPYKLILQDLSRAVKILKISIPVAILGLLISKALYSDVSIGDLAAFIAVPVVLLAVLVKTLSLIVTVTVKREPRAEPPPASPLKQKILLVLVLGFVLGMLAGIVALVSLLIYWMIGFGWAIAAVQDILRIILWFVGVVAAVFSMILILEYWSAKLAEVTDHWVSGMRSHTRVG